MARLAAHGIILTALTLAAGAGALTLAEAAAAGAAAAGAASAGAAARGERLLEARCGACHALGPSAASPLPEALPFRDIARLYPPVWLEEALAEGIVTGHEAMPEASFAPDEIAAITAYLEALGGR